MNKMVENRKTQEERRVWLIRTLMAEGGLSQPEIPSDEQGQKRLLRSLLNLRPPQLPEEEFLRVQDAYLQEEIRQKGITDYRDLKPLQPGIYLWQGDITTLQCGAIVNAANSQMLGCFVPGHHCIDNAIHTYAGVQLRRECAEMMGAQGHQEPAGKAKLTKAYNLPCGFILHTVGPIISREVTPEDRLALRDCYTSCLELAGEAGIKSVAFCCISTGVFRFPNQLAAEIAVKAVQKYKTKSNRNMEVIFDVFQNSDYKIYHKLLRGAHGAEGSH